MKHDLTKVRLGLTLVETAMWLTSISLFAGFIAALTDPVAARLLLLSIAAFPLVLHLSGTVLCLWVPEELPKRKLIYFSVVLTGAAMVPISVKFMAPTFPGFNRAIESELVLKVALADWFSLLLVVIGFVLFLLFIRSIAAFASAPHLCKVPVRLLLNLGAAVLAVACVGFFAVVVEIAPSFPGVVAGILVSMLIAAPLLCFLVVDFIVRYAILLSRLRSVLVEAERIRMIQPDPGRTET